MAREIVLADECCTAIGTMSGRLHTAPDSDMWASVIRETADRQQEE